MKCPQQSHQRKPAFVPAILFFSVRLLHDVDWCCGQSRDCDDITNASKRLITALSRRRRLGCRLSCWSNYRCRGVDTSRLSASNCDRRCDRAPSKCDRSASLYSAAVRWWISTFTRVAPISSHYYSYRSLSLWRWMTVQRCRLTSSQCYAQCLQMRPSGCAIPIIKPLRAARLFNGTLQLAGYVWLRSTNRSQRKNYKFYAASIE